MESNGESIKDIYFNEKISEYKVTLGSRNHQSGIIISKHLYLSGKVFTKLKCPKNVISVSCGDGYMGCILKHGKVFTFGNNNFGQLGHNKLIGLKISKISCGQRHTGIISKEGCLYMFGWNLQGQLGLGKESLNQYNTPQLVSLSKVISVSCGDDFTGAITEEGKLYMFGDNHYGQLGIKNNTNQKIPHLVEFPNKVISVCCGVRHTAVITEDNSLWTIGSNSAGQLGLGTKNSQYTFPQLVDIKAISVSCGNVHTAVISTDNTLWTFGLNSLGRLGLGNSDNKEYPSPQKIMEDITDVSCGVDFTLLLRNRKLYGFGSNKEGQLGLSDSIIVSPTKILNCVCKIFERH